MATVDEVVVAARQGRLRGSRSAAGVRFLGVPYAAAPAQAGRFAAPQRHESWDGVRDATAYGATALQPDRGVTIIPEPLVAGDNCLNLNVFTPDPGAAALPVLVWIHGGGFVGGCNASPWYVGDSFNRDGVVLVSVNYRLGAEGFLLLPDAPANRAVLDWVTALEWVQDNIGAFGGDPGRVTIAGQSAGGGACATLLAVPTARDLFRAAICMSGSAGLASSMEQARQTAGSLAAHLGVDLRREAFEQVDPAALLAGQDAVSGWRSAGEETAASLAERLDRPGLPFSPVVDGEVVAEPTLAAVAAPVNKRIALLSGTTANEFAMFLRDAGWVSADLLRAALVETGRSPEVVDRYLERQASKAPGEIAGQVITDRTFRLPSHELLAAAGTGFAYEFRWAPPEGPFQGLSMHCLDVPFVFDLLSAEGVREVAGGSPPQPLADAVHRAFVAFVTDLTPGWEPYESSSRGTMIFDEDCRVERDPLAFERSMWDSGSKEPLPAGPSKQP